MEPWLIVVPVIVGLVALYYFVGLILAAFVFKKVSKTVDKVVDRDPFDHPFFKQDHFGRDGR